MTLWLIWWFVTWVDNLVRPFIPVAYRPETYLPVNIPGLGLIFAFLALTLLGFLTANLIGRKLVDFGESLLTACRSCGRSIAPPSRFSRHCFPSSGSSFRHVGLVEFPAPGMWSLVFLTQSPQRRDLRALAGERARVGVHAVHAEPDDRFLLLRAARAM